MNLSSLFVGLDPRIALVGVVLLAMIGLVRYRMRLQFLRSVYDRAGSRDDLEVAGRVTEGRWQHLPWHPSQRARAHQPRTARTRGKDNS